MLKRLSNHWTVRLLLAASLPAWVLLLATATHGSPEVDAVAQPVMTALVIAGGLAFGGLGIWRKLRSAPANPRTEPVAPPEETTALQQIPNLIATAAFFAGCYQALVQFDVFSVMLERVGVTATPWQTLLALCAVQLLLLTIDALISPARRRN